MHDNEISWWIDSGATTHVCIDKVMFKSFGTINEERVLQMGNDSVAPIRGQGQVEIEFSSDSSYQCSLVLKV